MRILLLLLLAGAVSAQCEGNVACCVESRCVDCGCALCERAGGRPLGTNTSCDTDHCRCCEEPPVCEPDSFCRATYDLCVQQPACTQRWIAPAASAAEYCACVDEVRIAANLTAEQACLSNATLLLFVALLTSANSTCLLPPPPPPNFNWLLPLGVIFTTAPFLLLLFNCRTRRTRIQTFQRS